MQQSNSFSNYLPPYSPDHYSSTAGVNSKYYSIDPSEQHAIAHILLRSAPDSISLDEEVKLFNNNKNREKYDNMADLFSIIVLMEHLEKAFIRDSITADEYTPQCSNLIAKYKTALNFLSDSVTDLESFMATYKLSCPAAVIRFKIGVPATYEHAIGDPSKDTGKSAKYVAEVVQHFITLMDTLKLNIYAADSLHPILADLIQSLNNVTTLPADFDGKAKVRNWLITLNGMKASDEITDEQARQMLFDMERAHTEFYRILSGETSPKESGV